MRDKERTIALKIYRVVTQRFSVGNLRNVLSAQALCHTHKHSRLDKRKGDAMNTTIAREIGMLSRLSAITGIGIPEAAMAQLKPAIDPQIQACVRGKAITGSFTVAGSDTMKPLTQRWESTRRGVAVAVVSALCVVLGLMPAWAEQPLDLVRPVVDSSIASYQPKAGVSGAIAIAGSNTMQPIMVQVASAFKLWQPDIKIAVQGGGSDAAMQQFLQDQSTIRRGDANPMGHLVSGHVGLLASSRPLTDDERKDFRSRYGFEPTEIPIALDAIAIYVNHQNPLQSLTLEQVDAVFSQSRKRGAPGNITTWGQLGLADGWEQRPIRLYGRDKRSGTRTLFMDRALLDGTLKSEVKEEPGTAMEILDIGRDLLGIGYAGIGFQASTVRILPIAPKAGEAPIAPTAETAANGTYPLTRSLYLYAKRNPKGELEPEIAEFLRYINSREGQETIVRAGVYPLSSQQITTNLQALVGGHTSAASVMTATR